MDSKWREKQIKHAMEHFKDFVADFNDYGDIQTLDWRHKDGGSNYHVHYIFDTKQQYMYISGDLGSACFYLTWEPTFESMSYRIRDPWYIIEKMECSTDKYVYPDEYVRSEIEEYYKDLAPSRDDYDEGEDGHKQYLEDKEEFWETIESFIQAHDRHYGFQEMNCDRFDELQEIDGEWYEHGFGRCISTRVYCWFVGLEMAWKNYVQKEQCASYHEDNKVYELIKDATIEEISEVISAFAEIGTVEECQSAMEKQKPKKPDYEGDGYADGELVYDTWICPRCSTYYEVGCDDYKYCPECGQAIDWATEADYDIDGAAEKTPE